MVGQQATAMRKHCGPQRAQTRATITTEYQERFLHPNCHVTLTTTSSLKNPYHSLKGTSNDTRFFKSVYLTQKWMQNAPKAPQPSLPPKVQQKCRSAPHNYSCSGANQQESKMVDYTTVYKNDFQAWSISPRKPHRQQENLKASKGLIVTDIASKGQSQKNSNKVDANSKPDPQEQDRKPIDGITSYRSDYILHPVQPRPQIMKPGNQANKALPSDPTSSFGPKCPWHFHQELFNEAREFFEQFKTCSPETKSLSQGKAKVAGPPEDMFLTTTHADYIPHKCQRTKPILPSVQKEEKSKEPLPQTTTEEAYKAWSIQRRLPIIHKGQLEVPMKIRTPAESCKTNQRPSDPQLDKKAACNSSCKAAEKAADNGVFSFGCISTGPEESSMFWATTGPWPNGDMCDASCQPQENKASQKPSHEGAVLEITEEEILNLSQGEASDEHEAVDAAHRDVVDGRRSTGEHDRGVGEQLTLHQTPQHLHQLCIFIWLRVTAATLKLGQRAELQLTKYYIAASWGGVASTCSGVHAWPCQFDGVRRSPGATGNRVVR
ncbi:hypothetical protein INR49_011766, partial [Caranx melampygus]